MYSEKYTLAQCRERILKHLERYSSNGKVNVCGESEDIKNRLVTSLNVHLSKLWYEYSGSRKRSLLSFPGPECSFDFGSIKLSSGEIFTQYFGGTKLGFYIAVCGKGQLIFYTPDDTYRYIIDTEPGSFTEITGCFENTDGGDCHFLLGAEPFLDVKSFLVFEGVETASDQEKLLCGKGVSAAFLPCDCARITGIFEKENMKECTVAEVDEEKRILKIPSDACGRDYVIEYIPYAPRFEESCGDEAFVLMPSVLFDALCYMCAADLCPCGDGELYSKLTYKYRECLENIYDRHRVCRVRNSFYGAVKKRASSLLAGRLK